MFKPTQRQVFICLTVAICCACLRPAAQGVARVEPSKFILHCRRAGSPTRSKSPTPRYGGGITAVIYDWTLDQEGRLVTFRAGERADTLDGLIKFNPRRFKLAPGQSQYVRFTLTAPKSGDWLERRGIIFFEESRPSSDPLGSTMVFQVGTTVYLSFTETVHSFRLLGVKVEATPHGPPAILLGVANEGQAHIRYQIAYQISGEDGTPYAEGADDN